MNEPKTLTTTYRRLENVLFAMGYQAKNIVKHWDGSTVWEYDDTPEIRLIASTLKTLETQLKEIREGAAHD